MAPTRRRFLVGGAAALGGVLSHSPIVAPASEAPDLEATQPAISAGPPSPAQQPDPRMPTEAEVESWFRDRRNWGRWGKDDEMGAINLITPAKRAAAARLVKSGRTVSISHPYEPPQHTMSRAPESHYLPRGKRAAGSGALSDFWGLNAHDTDGTHLDAMCHIWGKDGMWQGRRPDVDIDWTGPRPGPRFAAITAWGGGIVTRGVLIDVPRLRGTSHVTQDRPVQGWELEEAARKQGVAVTAGDALLVYSGREAFLRSGGKYGAEERPGLGVTCSKFIRDHDVAVLGWDMLDARPCPYGLAFPVHGVMTYYGVALIDIALLEPLATACAEERRYEFLFMVLPLKVVRGTASPVNPVAMF